MQGSGLVHIDIGELLLPGVVVEKVRDGNAFFGCDDSGDWFFLLTSV